MDIFSRSMVDGLISRRAALFFSGRRYPVRRPAAPGSFKCKRRSFFFPARGSLSPELHCVTPSPLSFLSVPCSARPDFHGARPASGALLSLYFSCREPGAQPQLPAERPLPWPPSTPAPSQFSSACFPARIQGRAHESLLASVLWIQPWSVPASPPMESSCALRFLLCRPCLLLVRALLPVPARRPSSQP
jgi:hypothetical protein